MLSFKTKALVYQALVFHCYYLVSLDLRRIQWLR